MKSSGNAVHDQSAPSGKRTAQAKPFGKRLRGLRGDKSGTEALASAMTGSPRNGAWAWLRRLTPALAVNHLRSDLDVPSAVGSAGLVATAATANAASSAPPAASRPDGITASSDPRAVLFDVNAPSSTLSDIHRPLTPQSSPPLQAPRTASFAPTGPAMTPIAAWEASWRAAETNMTNVTGGAGDNPNPVLFAPTNTTTTTSTTLTTAATTSNAIVLENQKQGTPESVWMIGTADTTIEGFADQFSIDHGQTENFKINTNSKNYRIDIYRVGYYGGDGARLITTINRNLSTAQVQPVPIFDPTTREVDAGNWSVSASWAIPADAVSGVYFAELTRLDTGGQNIIPFVVRDDEAPSDITFQTSDTTWQAYNSWGGYNFYGGKDVGGIAGRAYALSYNRPFITRDGGFAAGPQDFLFGEEYPAIRWLEQNGYNVNYISGIDSARSGAQLLNSKVFLSVGHDEYWSADQRANVTAARNAGVNLAFLSGNEDYWQTRWASSIDGTNTPYKTLVSYKERWANANIDTQGTTSTWRDFQLGAGQPENGLSGTIFTVDSYRLDTMQIPYALSKLRFWSNTAVAKLQPGQVYSLTPNLLGYEWDSDLNNGFRPAGLIDLSSTTVNVNTKLLDYGNTVGAGTSTHSLTLYRAPSGALVFGAGSVYWSWGLDSHHDNEITPTDPNVQQAMVNLFADMGVQPATLMQSLAVAQQSTDHTAPTSVITSPTASGSYTAGTPITITGTATDSGGGVVADVEVSTNGGTTWDRATGYGNWTYKWVPLSGGTYTIESRAVDDSVNLETPSAGTTITVAPAAVTSLFRTTDVPAITTDSDTGLVNLGVKFSSSLAGTIVGLRYYKGLGDGGEHVGSIWSATGTLLASATFTQESPSGWQTVTFSNPISVTAGTTYVASYHSNGGYADTVNYFATAHTNGPLTAPTGNGYFTYSLGNAFPTTVSNGTNYWIDVLFSSASTNLLPVANNDSGFIDPKNTPITIAAATLLANDTDPDGDLLTVTGASSPSGGTVSFNSQTQAITFTPTTDYVGPGSFVYSISDGRGGVSSAAVSIAVGAYTLFAASDTPAVLSDVDASQVTLGVRFVSSQTGTITGLRYYKSASDTGTHVGSLWTSTGTLLASATYTNETASGWQTVNFTNPVSITAGTTYVASYHSNGHYTDTANYFTTAHVSGPLTAPTGNGVYTYGSGNLFPTSTYNAANYWADVIFNPVSSVNQLPVANNDSGFSTFENTALQISAAAVLANDTDPDGDVLTVTGVSAPTNGAVTYNASTTTITFTPTTGYVGSAGFTYAISDGRGGTASASVALTVTAPPAGVSLFAANATPATITVNDPNAVELGMKFTTSTNGTITGMRFYKGPQNTGTHTGGLWTSTGTLLGSLTFSNESASGWQTAAFATPISVTAGTTYVVGYHSNGFYSANSNYFSTSTTNGPLTAPSSASSGGNGVYAYGTASAFPTSTFNATNYWVDVIFNGQIAA